MAEEGAAVANAPTITAAKATARPDRPSDSAGLREGSAFRPVRREVRTDEDAFVSEVMNGDAKRDPSNHGMVTTDYRAGFLVMYDPDHRRHATRVGHSWDTLELSLRSRFSNYSGRISEA